MHKSRQVTRQARIASRNSRMSVKEKVRNKGRKWERKKAKITAS